MLRIGSTQIFILGILFILFYQINGISQFHNIPTTVLQEDEKILELISDIDTIDSRRCAERESCARIWMSKYNFLLEKIHQKETALDYKFSSNITEANSLAKQDFTFISNLFNKKTLTASKIFYAQSENWDSSLRRMFKLASKNILIKDHKEQRELSRLSSKLLEIFSTSKVCSITDNCWSLNPDLEELFKTSRNPETLLLAWKGWRDNTGKLMKADFTRIVEIMNKAAKQNGYSDIAESWLDDYEDTGIEKDLDDLFINEIMPLYFELHAYVRRKLENFYKFSSDSKNLIPAHLLGNMWAQDWSNIFDIVAPYPDASLFQVEQGFSKKAYTEISIFKEAERFIKSMGLYEMTPTFWKESILVKPIDVNREVDCHAAAYNFYNEFDFRIKMCTKINIEDFKIAHHELGHVEYFMAYRDQPAIFRQGANSGFHEAIGDTISLSAMTTKHLKRIGILDNYQLTEKQDMNELMKTALKSLVFLPFGYLLEKWRFEVFRGRINETSYNREWWLMRENFQGVTAPVKRSEEDFDPGCQFHIAGFVPYNRYFISHLLQFEFYKKLCDLSGHTGPLHHCDFFGSKPAGRKLKKVLKLGSSLHWKKALRMFTGKSSVTASALHEYFRPLTEWLIKENLKN